MADELTSKQVAVLAAGGVEEVELTQPREAGVRGGLIISRDPNDLPVFCRTIVQELAKDARSAAGADASN